MSEHYVRVYVTDVALVDFGDAAWGSLSDDIAQLIEQGCLELMADERPSVRRPVPLDGEGGHPVGIGVLPACNGARRYSVTAASPLSSGRLTDHVIEAAARQRVEVDVFMVLFAPDGQLHEAWEGRLSTDAVFPRLPPLGGVPLEPARLILTGELTYGQHVRVAAQAHIDSLSPTVADVAAA